MNIADCRIEADPDPNHYTTGSPLISPPLGVPFFGLTGARLELYLFVNGCLHIAEKRLTKYRVKEDVTYFGESLDLAWFRFDDDLHSGWENKRHVNLSRIPIAFYEANKIEEEESV